jgi:broad specificity phosphatase PhoE
VALLLVGAVHNAAAQPTIFLVRHAEKVEAGSGDPGDPDLSEAGRARADALATVLKDAKIKFVYATEFKRTQATARPTAQAAGVEVMVVPGNETAALVSKLKKARSNVLVVGHSNTVPDIIKAFGLPKPAAIGDGDYDNLFIVVRNAPPKLIRLHYR